MRPHPGALASVAAEWAFALAGAVACLLLTGALALDPHAPTNLWGDHFFALAAAKSDMDGHGFRLNPSLGFPAVQDYLYFPMFEATQRALLWLCAVIARQPFAAVVGYYAAGVVAMYAAAVWALRWLGVRLWIATPAAVAYVVSPYLMYRAFGHDFLALSYAAPMGMALALRIGAEPPSDLRAFLRRPFVVAAVVLSAGSGVYYGFFSLMFVAFAAAVASAMSASWRPALAGAALCGLMFAVLMVSGFGLDLPTLLRPNPSWVPRAPAEQLVYGLDLAGMALALDVTPHVHAGLAVAQGAAPEAFSSEGAGAYPGLVLTAILAFSPLIAAAAMGYAGRTRDAAAPGARAWLLIGLAGACATLGLLYGARGGLGFLFNLFASSQIRATGRIMPFLSFCALVAAAVAAERMTLSPRPWLRWGGAATICVALLAASAPSFGGLARIQRAHFAEPYQAAMRASLPSVIRAKDQAGLTRVLQLPIWRWPEAVSLAPKVDQYSPQLPYIYDHLRSPTRWSYGAAEAQGGFALRRLALSAPEALPARARAFGYDAILVANYAHPDGAPAPFTSLRAQLAPACRVYEDALFTLYSLRGACA